MQKVVVEAPESGSPLPGCGMGQASNSSPAPIRIAPAPKRNPNDYLNNLTALPPTPTLVLELLGIFEQPDKDVDQVVNLIAYEPAVTVELLKRCNSVHFVGEEPTVDVFEAVSRVGFYEVYCLVASLYAAKLKVLPGAAAALDVEGVWRHSVAVAVAAGAIAQEVGESRPLAFTTGLLHDVGRLILGSAEPAQYGQLLQAVGAQESNLMVAERAVFGTDHAELGAELLTRWKLPDAVTQAVRYHHNLAAVRSCRRATAVVQLADLLGLAAGPPDPENREWLLGATPALEALGFGAPDVPRLTALAEQGLEKVQGLLQG